LTQREAICGVRRAADPNRAVEQTETIDFLSRQPSLVHDGSGPEQLQHYAADFERAGPRFTTAMLWTTRLLVPGTSASGYVRSTA
jgi:hypothetical protein